MLESNDYSHLFRVPTSLTPLQARLWPYNKFWAAMVELLHAPRVYTFVTCKSPAFAFLDLQLGRPEVVPPSRHFTLLLGALSVPDIHEAFDKTQTLERLPLRDVIKFGSDALKARFLQRVAEETAGQPRLVHYFLEGVALHLRDIKQGLDSDAAIEAALQATDKRAEHVLHLQASRTPTPNGDDSNELCHALLLASVLDVPLEPMDKIVFDGQEACVLQLADKFNLYITPVAINSPLVRVRVAPCILRRMSLRPAPQSLAEGQSSFLIGLADGSVPVTVAAGGPLLEWVLRRRLTIAMLLFGGSGTKTWESIVPAFEGTAFGKTHIRLPMTVFPKVTQKTYAAGSATVGPERIVERRAGDCREYGVHPRRRQLVARHRAALAGPPHRLSDTARLRGGRPRVGGAEGGDYQVGPVRDPGGAPLAGDRRICDRRRTQRWLEVRWFP